MNTMSKVAWSVAATLMTTQAAAQAIFFEREGFEGRSFTTAKQVDNFDRYGFNASASSVAVLSDRWEVCENARFGGQCTVLRPGRYTSLGAMGLSDRVSSVRPVNKDSRLDDKRYAQAPVPFYANHRRYKERLYEANVTSVRAVLGTPAQRCWVEREQVSEDNSHANVPGAIAGALIGGVLGHQVGGGRGKDLATAGGVVAGAVVGANMGRDKNGPPNYGREVQRCTTAANHDRPEYWDVTYDFRGRQHRTQMMSPPGASVMVNRQGEPRV
ncbi:glycine zipper 2TM domain-containing protein [Chitinimonas arctica]|uniref:Glycine zipper 2TM domain-containing protein n=1 Tax=Chitinimonas arctica TaxID=2594795 RepID=A0A516SIE7_9NEIS|nr:beta/gamma crystallin-related protein [Chitinimonas arctica]QDQ27927.1 glycine zipper 2TM domain-containing protein [Chitinimonas arctica]